MSRAHAEATQSDPRTRGVCARRRVAFASGVRRVSELVLAAVLELRRFVQIFIEVQFRGSNLQAQDIFFVAISLGVWVVLYMPCTMGTKINLYVPLVDYSRFVAAYGVCPNSCLQLYWNCAGLRRLL